MRKSERETRTIASCQDSEKLGCLWSYNGERAHIEADKHTSETGHKTIVLETVSTVYFNILAAVQDPVKTHYTPRFYGYDTTCILCGIRILDDEDWESVGIQGVKHRSAPNGCVRALSRELMVLKNELSP